ncbi:MAG: hypothetical protein P1V97_13560 [Planctomycetota bacterium]|nr:hypothetical protein [Planctomycetota bacterium]
MDPHAGSSLGEAIQQMQAVKEEHRGILNKVASDPGMDPETRWALIEHLYDEEDEHLEHIAGLHSQGSAGQSLPQQSQGTPAPSSGLTVGSLRSPCGLPQSASGSVGSLRRSS